MARKRTESRKIERAKARVPEVVFPETVTSLVHTITEKLMQHEREDLNENTQDQAELLNTYRYLADLDIWDEEYFTSIKKLASELRIYKRAQMDSIQHPNRSRLRELQLTFEERFQKNWFNTFYGEHGPKNILLAMAWTQLRMYFSELQALEAVKSGRVGIDDSHSHPGHSETQNILAESIRRNIKARMIFENCVDVPEETETTFSAETHEAMRMLAFEREPVKMLAQKSIIILADPRKGKVTSGSQRSPLMPSSSVRAQVSQIERRGAQPAALTVQIYPPENIFSLCEVRVYVQGMPEPLELSLGRLSSEITQRCDSVRLTSTEDIWNNTGLYEKVRHTVYELIAEAYTSGALVEKQYADPTVDEEASSEVQLPEEDAELLQLEEDCVDILLSMSRKSFLRALTQYGCVIERGMIYNTNNGSSMDDDVLKKFDERSIAKLLFRLEIAPQEIIAHATQPRENVNVQIARALKGVDTRFTQKLEDVMRSILRGELDGLDYKKLKGSDVTYRARVGSYRILFEKTPEGYQLCSNPVRYRDEQTYAR